MAKHVRHCDPLEQAYYPKHIMHSLGFHKKLEPQNLLPIAGELRPVLLQPDDGGQICGESAQSNNANAIYCWNLSVNLMCPWSLSIAKARDSRDFPLKSNHDDFLGTTYDLIIHKNLLLTRYFERATWKRWERGCSRHKTHHLRSAKHSSANKPFH